MSIKSNLEAYERLFLSLGDKTRLKLLTLMANGPVSVGFLVDELGESQPKVSRHLAYLRNSGVVNTKREGKWIYYGLQRFDDPDVDSVIKFVIDTLLGLAPGESTLITKPPRGKAPTQETPERIEAAQDDSDSQIQDHDWEIGREADEVAVEPVFEEDADLGDGAICDNELEVFLL